MFGIALDGVDPRAREAMGEPEACVAERGSQFENAPRPHRAR